MLALFPFLHNTSYPVEYKSCNEDTIILTYEGEAFSVSLFNTKIIKEEGWRKTCSLLDSASEIRIEIDKSSRVQEPIPVYLFADQILIQEQIIKSHYAYPMIKNPEYKYEKRLEAAWGTTPTIAQNNKTTVDTKDHKNITQMYVLASLIIWIVLFLVLFKERRKKARKSQQKA